MDGSIVFFGRNPSIMALVRNQLAGAGYASEGYMDDGALLSRLEHPDVALLVLGGGIEDGPRLQLRDICQRRGIRLLEHYGGPDQLVENVRRALA
jgi:hypothetical protein